MNIRDQDVKSNPEQLSRILNQLMNAYSVDGVQLSKNTGIPTTTINRLRSGDPNNNPTLQTLIPIARFFSITVSQLIGEMPIHSWPLQKLLYVPILSWNEAIAWPNIIEKKERTMIATENEYSDRAFSLIVEEDDLEKLSKGTVLLIDPNLAAKHHDYILVYTEGQMKPSLKQLIVDNNQSFLKSAISGSTITEFPSDCKILGVLVEYKKYLKK